MGFNLIHMFERKDLLGQLVDELQALKLQPPQTGERFTFDNAQEALRKLQVKGILESSAADCSAIQSVPISQLDPWTESVSPACKFVWGMQTLLIMSY